VVEHLLAKEDVASSNLVFRSIQVLWRRSQVVKAGVCKTPIQRFKSARRLVILCRGGGMADAADLKSASRKGVWVRVPPSADFSSVFQRDFSL
jgi:hypothetical protein